MGAPKKVSPEKIAEAKTLRGQGLGIREIAKRIGLSVGSVSSLLKAVREEEGT